MKLLLVNDMNDWNLSQYAILKSIQLAGEKLKNPILISEIPRDLRKWLPRDEEEAQRVIASELYVAINEGKVEIVEEGKEISYVLTEDGKKFVEFTDKRLKEIEKENELFHLNEEIQALLQEGIEHEKVVVELLKRRPELEKFKEEIKEKVEEIKQKSVEKYFSKEEPPGRFIPELLAKDILQKVKIVTLKDTEEILYYDEKEGIWKFNGEALIKNLATKLLGEKTKTQYLNETLNYIKAVTYVDRKIFDNQPIYLLPVKNGVLNLETLELLPYKPEYYFTSKLPVAYDANADCPKIRKFLSEIVMPEDVELLIEIAAYCLWRSYPIQKAFMLVGDGANGKSTYLQLLQKFLGSENTCSVSLQELEHNRFASANLYRKLANIYADLPSVALQNPGVFKMLTGGDVVKAEKKFKDFFFFVNYAKLLYSANRVPYVADESEAFFRRWIIINFPFKFEPNPNGPNSKLANPNILQEITTEEELSGFLNLALSRLKKVLTQGFSYAKTTEEIREAYIRASDPIGAFVMDCVVQSPTDYVKKDELYNAYAEYCRERKLIVVDKAVFSKNLRRYVTVEDFRPMEDGKRVTAWKGIKLIKSDNLVNGNVKAVNDVKVISNFNIISNFNKLKIKNHFDELDSLDTNWFSGKCSYCGNDTQVTLYQGHFICKECLKEEQNKPKCYKCGSTLDLTQTEDFITHKPLWICKKCLEEVME
jgi:putative DNA primase/helicase